MILDHRGKPFDVEDERGLERQDRWENAMTGIGTSGDKTTHGRFLPVARVPDQELTNLHSGSDLAAKVVDDRPDEMFRRGFKAEADGVKASEVADVREFAREKLHLEENFKQGSKWGRLYGGHLLVMNIDDGRAPYEPVDENNIRSFNSMAPVDRRFAFVISQYSDYGPNQIGPYGEAQIYLVSNAVAVSGWNEWGALKKRSAEELRSTGASVGYVHESRVIRFDGIPADVLTRQALAGWSWSVMQRVYNTMRAFDHAFDSSGYLLSDAAQGVLKLQGLIQGISMGKRQAIMDRARLADMTRSVMRAIVLDAGDKDGKNAEEFTRVPTPLAGVADILEMWMSRFAAAADEPQTRLFGRSPAGMNATGESDIRDWYSRLESEQQNELTPKLRRVLRLLGLAKKGPLRGRDVDWIITHHPLWSPTDSELATTRKTNAERDHIYIDDGVVRPEEVAVDLGEVYPNLDVKAREDVLKGGESFEPYPNDPEPPAAEAGLGNPGEPGSPAVPVAIAGAGAPKVAAVPVKAKAKAPAGSPAAKGKPR